jgi:hypothetical protein
MKKKVFCAACQIETDHEVKVIRNAHGHDEIHFACVCGRVWKLPANLPKEELARLIAEHAASNIGQVPASDTEIPADHPALKHLSEI